MTSRDAILAAVRANQPAPGPAIPAFATNSASAPAASFMTAAIRHRLTATCLVERIDYFDSQPLQ
jgi:hypothetical protein